ncbi:LOW QUALITY PROTEIN: hypothetical protein OSB04_028438 [Centaurea solstitialis]|uniref:Uncharacterized protein n=1 Tax=Centaurea solstitialis TaxID=347529 RepID=A0AA38SZ96_9ASTR|nr:LOW QUALITY PROTEIN: hypothetical protein OSB04_028438 [Centaurea solstitialis]
MRLMAELTKQLWIVQAGWFLSKAQVGDSWSCTRANRDGDLFGCDDEKVPATWVHGLFWLTPQSISLRGSTVIKFPDVPSEDQWGFSAGRQVKLGLT